MSRITASALVSQGEDQVFTVVEGQAVLMSVGNGKYYSLDDIGTRIWNWIATPTPVGVLCDRLDKDHVWGRLGSSMGDGAIEVMRPVTKNPS